MRPEDITVEVRSLALGRIGQIDLEYITDLKLIKRFCNVGAWTMSLPVGFDMADELAKPGRGITVTGPNGFSFSGPMISAIHVQDTDDPMGTWQYTGADDNIYLADALAFPEPSNPDTETQSESHDVRTGVAEDVLRGYVDANIGPSAPSARRALVPFALGTYAGGLGAVVTGRARFPQLGQLLSDVASAGGVGFDMVQVGNEIQFVVYEPQDRSGEIRMDIDNDLLDKVEYGLGAPGGTRYVVAGQGEGVDRRIIQVTDSLAESAEELWGRRVEVFKDRRDTDDDAELVQEGTEGVQTNGRTITSLAVTPADDTTMVYGKDWFLGDIVTVVVGGQELQTIVTEAIISISEDGVLTAATIGDPTGFDYESKLAVKQEQQEQRLAFLEKNSETFTVERFIELARGLAKSNLIINGDFRINQRQYASGASLTPGVLSGYGHDRWRTAGRVNRVRNPRASVNTTDWNGLVAANIARQASGGPIPEAPTFMRATLTSTGTGRGMWISEAGISVVGKRAYYVSIWVRTSVASTVELSINDYSAVGGTDLQAHIISSPVLANTWTLISSAFETNPQAVGIRFHIRTSTSMNAGSTLDATAVMLTESPVSGYVDGDMAGCMWLGTAGASMSIDRTVLTSYTFTQAPNGCIITINSGGAIQQVIERADMPAGDYTLSWDGTAQARVYKNSDLTLLASIASSPLTFTTDGSDDIVVEFEAVGGTATLGNVNLVAGAAAYPFRPRPIGEELALAQRYYWATRSTTTGNARMFMGFQQSTVSAFATVNYPVTMRVLPIMTFTGAWYWSDLATSDWAGTSLTILNTSARLDGCMVQLSGFSGGAQFRPGTLGLPGGSGGLYFHAEF